MFEIFNEIKEDIEEITEIKKLLEFSLDKLKVNNAIFNVILINNKEIKKINKEYRGKDSVTDVISFALEDVKDINYDFRLLGDIYISIEKAREQAIEYEHSFLREISFLTIHGLLHLLGYDHMDIDEEKIMFDLQEMILSEYGIKR